MFYRIRNYQHLFSVSAISHLIPAKIGNQMLVVFVDSIYILIFAKTVLSNAQRGLTTI